MWSRAGDRYDHRLGKEVAGLALPADGLAKGATEAVIEAERTWSFQLELKPCPNARNRS